MALSALLWGASARAAFEERPFSARSAALGEAMTAASGAADGVFYNPATLAFSPHAELLSSHTRLFSLSELPYTSLAAAWPAARWGAWGLGYSRFGPSFYQEEEITLAQGVRISSRVSVGYAVKRSSVRLRRYGSDAALGLDAGLYGRWLPRGAVGFCFRNLNRPRFGATPEGPPQEIRMGMTFRPMPAFSTSLDAVKPVRGKLSWRAGEEVRLASFLSVRLGFETSPNRYAAGTGLILKGWRLDYALLSHPFLPEQHHVSFSLVWGPFPARLRGRKAVGLSAVLVAGSEVSSPGPPPRVDVNAAAAEELESLPGVGPATARKILEYRARNGPFRRDVDLLKVPGLRRKLFLRLRPRVTVGAPEDASPPAVSPPPESGVPRNPQERPPGPSDNATPAPPAP